VSRTLLIAPAWLGQSGLWTIDARGRRRATDAEEIGLSDGLGDRLEAWMDRFDAIYEEEQDARSRFPDPAEQAAWESEGEGIVAAIRAELGPSWTVEADLTGWREATKP
jgi:hypothetical protein